MFDELQSVIKAVEAKGAEFVDARYDELTLRTIIKENGRITQFKDTKRAGAGFNVYYGGATAYAFSADLSKEALTKAAIDALGIAKASSSVALIKAGVNPTDPVKVNLDINLKKPAWLADPSEKVDYINRIEASALEHGEEISSTVAMYGEMSGKKYFTNSEGTEIYWTPYILEMRANVTSRSPITGDLVIGNDLIGGSVGLEFFDYDDCTPEDLGRRAAKFAIEQFDSKPAPSGDFRALIENSLTGVLTHESFGHMSEADFAVVKQSPISDKVDQRLGSDLVTVIDEGVVNGTSKDVTGFWLPYDDEGTKTERTVIMEEGIFKGFLHTRSTAKTMNAKPTGNGRALAFIFPPIPRMKNTYITPGDLTEEEALEQLGEGIYCISWNGGQANMDGTFSFKAARAYWVANGEIQYPLKDVALSGNILDFLYNIEGKTKDFELRSTFFGGCGKGGQNGLATGVGGPKVILSKSHFGGQKQ